MHRILFALLPLVLYLPCTATAAFINTEDFAAGKIMIADAPVQRTQHMQSLRSLRKEENKLLRAEKRMTKLEQYLVRAHQRNINGISDSTDRWFWFWVIGWGTGLLLTLLAGGAIVSSFFGILWLLGFGLGSASLIVWLVKRFK